MGSSMETADTGPEHRLTSHRKVSGSGNLGLPFIGLDDGLHRNCISDDRCGCGGADFEPVAPSIGMSHAGK